MLLEFQAKIGTKGFTIARIEIRRAGATAGVGGCPVWAIIDTAAAKSFIHPDWMHNVPGLAATDKRAPFTTAYGGDEAKCCEVSLWLPGQGGKKATKLLDLHRLGILKVKVQSVLIGKDLLAGVN